MFETLLPHTSDHALQTPTRIKRSCSILVQIKVLNWLTKNIMQLPFNGMNHICTLLRISIWQKVYPASWGMVLTTKACTLAGKILSIRYLSRSSLPSTLFATLSSLVRSGAGDFLSWFQQRTRSHLPTSAIFRCWKIPDWMASSRLHIHFASFLLYRRSCHNAHKMLAL